MNRVLSQADSLAEQTTLAAPQSKRGRPSEAGRVAGGASRFVVGSGCKAGWDDQPGTGGATPVPNRQIQLRWPTVVATVMGSHRIALEQVRSFPHY